MNNPSNLWELFYGDILKRISKDELIDFYITQKMSSVDISKKIGVSHRSVLNWLKYYEIPIRNLSESHYAKNRKEIPKEFSDYDTMYNLYVVKHYTKEQLGAIFDCAPHVIDRVLKNLGIHVRGSSEAKIGVQSGSSHHNWKGGISDLYSLCREYFQTNISPKIRERDNYTCQLCGLHSNLHVHHIISFSSILEDIIKENEDIKDKEELYKIIVNHPRFNDENNLITYCKNCHFYKIHKYKR